jgi:hypothetical protein
MMKPSRIFEVLDLALQARVVGKNFNSLFAGAAGIGKSEICQAWVSKQKRERNPNFGFIDMRVAYLEAPDFIGFPGESVDAHGVVRTSHRLPEFWPTDPDSEGLLLLEEPNRGTTAVMNCLMQLLTDRKVHNYTLPKGWIIAAAVNPDSAEYDVNTMDAALRNRFASFEVEYDHNTFVSFMEENDWCQHIVYFVKSGTWTYKDASSVGKDSVYISPRTWSQLNAAHKAGALNDKQLHRIVATSILGKDIGNEFWKFVHDDAPVTAQDLLKNKKKALSKLKEQSKPDAYQGDKIAVTVESIIKEYGGANATDDKVSEETMVEVAKIISSDQAVNLLKGCGLKSHNGNITDFFKDFCKRHPDLVDVLKANIKLSSTK